MKTSILEKTATAHWVPDEDVSVEPVAAAGDTRHTRRVRRPVIIVSRASLVWLAVGLRARRGSVTVSVIVLWGAVSEVDQG